MKGFSTRTTLGMNKQTERLYTLKKEKLHERLCLKRFSDRTTFIAELFVYIKFKLYFCGVLIIKTNCNYGNQRN